tara:strand:+ start:195 stop:1061 length:867 start_codon:yes stop_codon:yes gene_type:complete
MNTQKHKTYVVIVHYGDSALAQRAVAALKAGSQQPDEIVVVDHNPEPLVLEAVEGLRVVRPSTNDGYGAGLNFGIGTLFSDKPDNRDIIVGMNNDVVVLPDTLTNLRQWWDKHPEPALVGVIAEEGKRRVGGGGRINPITGRARLSARPLVDSPLTYVHGAFFSAPWEVMMRVRGLPEHYFMYWEDVSLSLRARQMGVPLKVAETVRVTHSEESPSQLPDAKLYYLVRNGALCLSTDAPWPYRPWWRLYSRLRLQYHQARGTKPVVVEALRDAAAGQTGRRQSAKQES